MVAPCSYHLFMNVPVNLDESKFLGYSTRIGQFLTHSCGTRWSGTICDHVFIMSKAILIVCCALCVCATMCYHQVFSDFSKNFMCCFRSPTGLIHMILHLSIAAYLRWKCYFERYECTLWKTSVLRSFISLPFRSTKWWSINCQGESVIDVNDMSLLWTGAVSVIWFGSPIHPPARCMVNS